MRPVFDEPVESIYLDNAATTMMDDDVVDAMLPYLRESFGNAETPYHLGRESADAVELARERVAELIDVDPKRIFFTSGGTEANNWAIRCVNRATRRIICSSVEHASVILSAKSQSGMYCPVKPEGVVDLDVMDAVAQEHGVDIISVQHANNEIGTIQPVAAVAEIARKHEAVFHMDAVQSYGKFLWAADDTGADLISLSAHKIHGPMGIGALYVREGIDMEPLLYGGSQESGMRAGTLAVPSIVGFGVAADIARTSIRHESPRQQELITWLASELKLNFGATINGDELNRLPSILNFTLPDVEGNVVAAVLNRHYGMCIACGAACETRKGVSHVLKAIGMTTEQAQRTLRVSISRFTTTKHVRKVVSCLHMAIKEARERAVE